MPYNNIPESEWANMDKCVSEVEAQGHDKQSAIAICHTSIMGRKTVAEAMQMLKDGKIDIKAITGQKAAYPWDQCIQDQLDHGYSQDSANKICGFIRNGGKGMPTNEELTDILKQLKIDQPIKAEKAGARHSSEDRAAIRSVRIKAREIHDLSVQLEPGDSDELAAKAEGGNFTAYDVIGLFQDGAVKAIGDWALDVLGVPFGGPKNGKDLQGEKFTTKTNLHLEYIKELPVIYGHGMSPNGKPETNPVIIGKAKFDHTDERGHWFKVILDKTQALAQRIWDAARKGIVRASSDSVSHLVRIGKDGEILNWPLAGISLVDLESNLRPVNAYAVALPAVKTMFENAGMTMPVYPEEVEPQADGRGAGAQSVTNAQASIGTKSANKGVIEMDEKDLIALLDKRDAEKAAKAEAEAAEKVKSNAAFEARVTAEKAKWEAEAAKGRRLPGGGGPLIA